MNRRLARSPLAGALLALAAAGCFGAGADHERLGDTALAAGDGAKALAEYQAAAGTRANAQLYAKIGAAALRARRLREAAEAYRALVADDPSRLDESATGLELVAEAAEHARDATGLSAAVSALRDVAPERLAARHALALVRTGGLEAPELVAVLPYALAAAPDAGVTDSLLLAYGNALRETTACDQAMSAYTAVTRRSRDARALAAAKAGLAACGVRLGEQAVTIGDPYAAEKWFGAALAADPAGGDGRRARLGLADLRRAQGDLLGAAIAYQAVLSASATDSLGVAARAKLDSLGAAVPDSR
ncbi:MAG TPA: hypothetical protein VFS07_05450 [Gemmatimonadales bacterium]|nr:hypothetical protein [Gemmatimonadales bacterium]